MTSQFFDVMYSPNLFEVVLFLLLNLVTDPSFMAISSLSFGVMTIFFYKRLARHPEIGNTTI